MPADPSSPIQAAVTQLAHAQPLHDSEPPHLLAYLTSVPDPRAARGRRHPLVAILGLAAAAVLAGARSIAAIAEWAADAPQRVRAAFGARHHAPGHCSVPAEATIRRVLSRLDADVLAVAIGAWLADRDRHRELDGPGPATCRRAVAVDGKSLRGARAPTPGDGRPMHLLACMDHATRAVLAQRQVGGAPEEVSAFALLADLDLAGVVVTADALQTHPEAAEFLVTRKRAHDLFTVKASQPTLLAHCQRLPWHRVPVADPPVTVATAASSCAPLKAVSVRHFGFPHAAQVIQVTRKTRGLHTNRWRAVTVYAITSLSFELARPARLADLVRGHWGIEAFTTSATSPSPRMPPRCAPATRPGSWRACPTWPSASCAAEVTPTSPPRCATTPVTPPVP